MRLLSLKHEKRKKNCFKFNCSFAIKKNEKKRFEKDELL
jgi:hypothetical protein